MHGETVKNEIPNVLQWLNEDFLHLKQKGAIIIPKTVNLFTVLKTSYKYNLEAYSEIRLQAVFEDSVFKVTFTHVQTLLSPWQLISHHATDSLRAWRFLKFLQFCCGKILSAMSASLSSCAEGSSKPTNLTTSLAKQRPHYRISHN